MPDHLVYESHYSRPNHYNYQDWLYLPYIKSLTKALKLQVGSTILDFGCGQGYFSNAFNNLGLIVHGIDKSSTGISYARSSYPDSITFSVGDEKSLDPTKPYDYIFIRSCSVYNTIQHDESQNLTKALINNLKPNGILIWDYYTRFKNNSNSTWLYHQPENIKQIFPTYKLRRIYFINRLDTLLLRSLAFHPLVNKQLRMVSKALGLGGELIAIIERQ